MDAQEREPTLGRHHRPARRQWYHIMVADVKSAGRNVKQRFKKHPIVSSFFIINLFVAIALILNLVIFMQNQGYDLPVDTISEVEVFIILFILVFVRVFAYTYRNLLKQRAAGLFFTLDLSPGQLLLGKFFAFLSYIVSIILVAVAIGIAVMLLFDLFFVIPLSYLLTTVLLVVFGTLLGVMSPIMIQIEPIRAKLQTLAIPLLLAYGVYLTLTELTVGMGGSLLFLGTFTLLGGLALRGTVTHLQRAWVTQSMKNESHIVDPTKDYLQPLSFWREVNFREAIVARKELVIMFRDRDTILAIIAAVVTGISLIILYFVLGPAPAEMGLFRKYFYPSIVGMAMVAGAIIDCAYLGLSSVSAEGRKLWLLKILPVRDIEIVRGKTLAIFILSTPLVYFITLPVQFLAGFPLRVIGYFVIATMVLILVFIGLGMWVGARFPNFDRSMRGIPDIMSIYFLITLCILVGLPLLAFPLNIVRIDPSAAYIAFFMSLFMSMVFLILLTHRAAAAYGTITIDAYQ